MRERSLSGKRVEGKHNDASFSVMRERGLLKIYYNYRRGMPEQYATVAERPNATDCKSVKPCVQITPVAPEFKLGVTLSDTLGMFDCNPNTP